MYLLLLNEDDQKSNVHRRKHYCRESFFSQLFKFLRSHSFSARLEMHHTVAG